MATIEEILDACNARLDTIPDLRVSADWPESINPPAAGVQVDGLAFDDTLEPGSAQVTLAVHVWTSRTVPRVGLRRLYQFMAGAGESSVKQALETDPTWDGLVFDAHVTECRAPGVARFGEMQYYAVQIMVVVGVDGVTG